MGSIGRFNVWLLSCGFHCVQATHQSEQEPCTPSPEDQEACDNQDQSPDGGEVFFRCQHRGMEQHLVVDTEIAPERGCKFAERGAFSSRNYKGQAACPGTHSCQLQVDELLGARARRRRRDTNVGVAALQGMRTTNIEMVLTGSLLSAIPPIMTFLLFEKYLAAGVNAVIGK